MCGRGVPAASALLLGALLSTSAFAGLGASVTVQVGQPTSIRPSEVTQLEITLSNNSTSSSINAVAFSNNLPGTLPNGLKVAGAPTYTCFNPATSITSAGAGVLTAALNTQAIALSGGVIPARAASTDGYCTIRIPVTAGTSNGSATSYNYTIANGAVTGNDGAAVANTGAVNQSVNVLALSLPTISKAFGNSTLYLGGAATTLTITVTNPNTVALPNFSVTDLFPTNGGGAIIQVAATPAANSTCTAGGTPATFTPAGGATSLSATGGTVAANGSCTLTVDVTARQTNSAYNTGFISNVINGASDFSNEIGLVPANATADVRAVSPLGVTKTFNNGAIASGQSDTFSIVFSNSATSPLTINSFADSPIDSIGNAGYGLKLSGVPSMSCTAGGTAGTFALTGGNVGFTQTGNSTIAAGGTCTITGTYVGTVQNPNTPVSFTNNIAEGAVGVATPNVISQAASASVLVLDTLRIFKVASPANPTPGNPVRYDVTVENWSNASLANTVISDTLTNGQTFLTGTIGGIDYTPTLSGAGCSGITTPAVVGATSAALTIATVPARSTSFAPGSCTVRFWSMTATNAADASAVNNVLGAGSVCYNAGATCNGGASQTTASTVTTATLSAVKAFSPAGPLSEGVVSRMTITLSNLSVNPLTSVSISDTLPIAGGGGQMRVAPVPNAATTCAGSPVITAVANSTSVTLNSATVPARAANGTGAAGTCLLQVDVVGTAGIYNNSASIAGTQSYANGGTAAVGPITANASLTYTSSLSATKSFTPSAVSSGGKSTVRVRLNNAGAVGLTGVAVTDPLPTGMVLANPVNAYTTCAGSSAFSGAAGASSISMTGATIAGGGSCDMLFDVVATGSANWVNTIPIGGITADGGVSNLVAVAATLNFNAPTGITVAKATNPSTLTFPGQVSQMTITITNGTTPVTNLALTDYFTADGTSGAAANGMRVGVTPAASTTCPSGVVTAAPNGSSVSLSGATMVASASCTITLNVTSTTTGGITNYIPVGGISTAQGLSNASLATTSLTTQGNIGITKQFTPSVIEPNQRSRLRITFYNPANQPASGVSVTDTLPAGVSVPVGPNATTTCTGATVTAPTAGSVSISGGSIPAASGGTAASCYAEIDVTSAAQGDYLNTIPISALTATVGGAPATNSQAATATLRVKSPLVIHKAIANQTLDAGNPATFTTGTATRASGAPATLTIFLSNPNSVPLTQASFTDSLPTGLVVAQTPNAASTCSGAVLSAPASATNIGVTGATIPASGSCTISVDVLSNISGSYTNVIPVGGVSTLEGVTNDEATSARLLITAPPTVSKQFAPPVIGAGGTSTMTIFFNNANSTPATLSSVFTDTLPVAPGAVVVAATPNVTKSCPGGVTAAAGAGTISYANGAQIPAGGCYISVDVTASTAGVHTNNIPAGALQTDLGNNQDPANATLTVSPLGFIAGKIFRDNNVTPNGTFQAGTDSIISGAAVELRSGATCAGGLVSSQMTDSSGNYSFSGLAAGTYSVCQPAQPSGTVNGAATAGSITSSNSSTGAVGAASNPSASTSQIVGIVLNGDGGSGEVSGSPNNNFAEIVLSSITGRVFLDQNNSGTFNGADAGIAGVTVNLTGTDVNSTPVTATTTTDALGNYSFSNLMAGTYTVTEPTQPANSSSGLTVAGTVPNGGTAGSITAPTTLPSRISNIILPPNTVSPDNNFAEIPNGKIINGRVFLDYNNSGTADGADYGLANVSITLTGTDTNGNPVTASTTTDASGNYAFMGLPAGTYTINQLSQPANTSNGIVTAGSAGGTASNPSGTSSRVATIDLTSPAVTLSAANNFAEIPGAAPDLTITKTHSPISFGEGSTIGIFTITPSNLGATPTSGVVTIVDTLPTGMTLAAPATGTGWACSGAVGATSITCTTSSVIASASAGNPISLRVAVAANTAGQLLTNSAVISGGGEPTEFNGNNTATDTVAITSTASLSGKVWRDIDHDRVLDAGEERVAGWTVELLYGGNVIHTTTTNASGVYSFAGISPGTGYQVRFKEPTTGMIFGNAVPNEQGIAAAPATRDSGTTVNSGSNAGNPAGAVFSDGTLSNLTLYAGDNIVEQSLPLDPAGVVYDAVTRLPVAGAQVTITGPAGFNPATHLVGGTAVVTTGADGLYQFLLNPTAPVGTYTLAITTYPAGYIPAPSTLIPVCANTLTVGAAPDPALIQTAATTPTLAAPLHNTATCPANSAALAPANQASTQHFFSFVIDPTLPSADILNNHIPIDPIGVGAIVVSKTTPLVNVNVGQLVPYTIAITNTTSTAFANLNYVDVIPAGFKYKKGSSTVNGVALEPSIAGRTLTWGTQTLPANSTRTIKLLLVVGTGVQTGEYVNTAHVASNVGNLTLSNIASATVRVIPDPLFDCSEIIGKVFDDKNANGYQDQDESGIASVRVATVNGQLVTTDAQGRFHIACAAVPDSDHGSNFVMKLDERTLPTGYRVTTENPRDVRLTRGKMTKLNFGATIHKVVRVDMRANAFDSGADTLNATWRKQLEALPERMKTEPVILRLGYAASAGEDAELARRRVQFVSHFMKQLWEEKQCAYPLQIEEELSLPSSSAAGGKE